MRKKPRTARAVAANLGVQKEYARRLRNALRMLLRDALKDLHQELGMAHDAAGGFEPSPSDITRRFAADMARWMVKAGQVAKAISRWFCAAMYRTTTHAQKQALKAAGVSEKSIDARWGIPVLKRQYISPTAAKNLQKHIEDNTKLITKMASQDLARLQGLMEETNGQNVSFSDIENLLKGSQGFDEERENVSLWIRAINSINRSKGITPPTSALRSAYGCMCPDSLRRERRTRPLTAKHLILK